MTSKIYIRNYRKHNIFGGEIYRGDFDVHHSMSDIAARIISDQKFDKRCHKNVENRDWMKKYKKGK